MSYKILDVQEQAFNPFDIESDSVKPELSEDFNSMFTLLKQEGERSDFIFNTLE